MVLTDGTVLFGADEVTIEELREVYPTLALAALEKLQKMSNKFPPSSSETTFIYADTDREHNTSGFIQVISGRMLIGINNPKTSVFETIHEIHAGQNEARTDIIGVYFPKEFPTNNISLRAASEGLGIVRMSDDFVLRFWKAIPGMKERFLKIHSDLLNKMIAGTLSSDTPTEKQKMLLFSRMLTQYIKSVKEFDEEEEKYFVKQIESLIAIFSARKSKIPVEDPSIIVVQELIGALARDKANA